MKTLPVHSDLAEVSLEEAIGLISHYPQKTLSLIVGESNAYVAGYLTERFGLSEAQILPDAIFANCDAWMIRDEFGTIVLLETVD